MPLGVGASINSAAVWLILRRTNKEPGSSPECAGKNGINSLFETAVTAWGHSSCTVLCSIVHSLMWLSRRGGSVETSEHSLAGRNERSSSLPCRLDKVSNSLCDEKYCNFLPVMTSKGYYGRTRTCSRGCRGYLHQVSLWTGDAE